MVLLLILASCAGEGKAPLTVPVVAAPETSATPVAASSAVVSTALAAEPPVEPAAPIPVDAVAELFGADAKLAHARCPGEAPEIGCLLSLRYEGDEAALKVATALQRDLGVLAGVLPEQMMDGGYRGLLHLDPVVPTGRERTHLAWVSAALFDIDAFVRAIAERAKGPVAYSARPRSIRFFRSRGAHTPAAFAGSDVIAYNVAGSINTSAITVRETLFHELFHLADEHAAGWSESALGELHRAIVEKCGAKTACLRPFAPHDTQVRGGTYYAFQPGNGPAEYAAELAVRYFRETRAALAEKRFEHAPFKCGGPENERAWKALVDRMFGGVDATPACDPPKKPW